jgi:hypothetical protein
MATINLSTQTGKKWNFRDTSLWSLIGSNLIGLLIAYKQGWGILPLLWIYWFQSVSIGVVNVIRMVTLKNFSTEGLTSNGRPVPATKAGQISTALFFAVHYGFFHLVYALFLGSGMFSKNRLPPGEPLYIFYTGILFFFNHLYSFFHNRETDVPGQNLGTIMFFPYIRIVPMHLFIIFGGMLAMTLGERSFLLLTFFVLLKTGADTLMHMIEHVRRPEIESKPPLKPGEI